MHDRVRDRYMLHVQRITAADDLSVLRDDWNRLSGDVPFRRFAWCAAWWKHYQSSQRELYVLTVRDAQQSLVGIAPWFLERHPAQGRFVQWMGAGETCSDYPSVLTSAENADVVTEALANWLSAAAEGEDRWDLLHLDNAPADDAAIARLVSHLWIGGATMHREPGVNCWRIEIPATWDDYVAALSKSHRKQVRRFERRMIDTQRATFHPVTSEADLKRGMEILVDLHQRRRQSLNEPGCFASERFHAFMHEVADELFAEDRLRLSWIEIDDTPAAVEFQLAGGATTYAYQAGVNPDLLDEEPGRIINIATIRQAIEQGHTGFDFLRGDEPYKAHWRATPRETVTYRIVPQRTLAQVRHGLWLAGGNVKNWVKTGLELAGMR